MSAAEVIPRTYDDAVNVLVRWHAEGGPSDLRVFSFPDPLEQVVRLAEVSSEFMPTGTVRAMALGRSAEFPFKSAVALVTPEEWQEVKAGSLPLPPGWDLASMRQVWP